MKRAAALILCILLIGSIGLNCYSRAVTETADKVEFTETVLFGDPKEAEGLHVRFTNQASLSSYLLSSLSHYLWTTDFVFKDGAFEALTEQRYTLEQATRETPEAISVRDGLSANGEYQSYMSNDLISGYRKQYEKELKDGSVSVRTSMSELFEYYPLSISVMTKGTVRTDNYRQEAYQDRDLDAKMQEYFRFPIEEDHELFLTLADRTPAGIDIQKSFIKLDSLNGTVHYSLQR